MDYANNKKNSKALDVKKILLIRIKIYYTWI